MVRKTGSHHMLGHGLSPGTPRNYCLTYVQPDVEYFMLSTNKPLALGRCAYEAYGNKFSFTACGVALSIYISIQWALQYGVYLLSGTHLRGGGAICGTRYGILAARPPRGTPYVQFTTAWLAIACSVSSATTRFCLVSPGSS